VPGPAPILGPETLGVILDGTLVRGDVEKPGLDGEVNRPAEKFGVLGPVKLGALGVE